MMKKVKIPFSKGDPYLCLRSPFWRSKQSFTSENSSEKLIFTATSRIVKHTMIRRHNVEAMHIPYNKIVTLVQFFENQPM